MKLLDMQNAPEETVFALVYGGSGTGKTHLIGTLAELGPVLVPDIDKGWKTLKYAPDLQKYSKNIHVCSFDQFGDLDTMYKLVDANDPDRWTSFFRSKGDKDALITEPFLWIAPDTWSELQWYMLEELRSKDPAMKGKGLNFRENVQIKHWGQMTDLNKLAVEAFRDCKVNMIFSMQEKMDKDELSGQIFGGPSIHGKMVQEMPTYFDLVIRTYCDPAGNYCATTKAKGRWVAKSRISTPGDFKNPTMKQILGVK